MIELPYLGSMPFVGNDGTLVKSIPYECDEVAGYLSGGEWGVRVKSEADREDSCATRSWKHDCPLRGQSRRQAIQGYPIHSDHRLKQHTISQKREGERKPITLMEPKAVEVAWPTIYPSRGKKSRETSV